MTQQERILQHLQELGSITPMQALTHYGCFRLGARIYNLRRLGHVITSELIQHGHRRYALYTLRKGDAQ
jgi:hypothetical protein